MRAVECHVHAGIRNRPILHMLEIANVLLSFTIICVLQCLSYDAVSLLARECSATRLPHSLFNI